MFSLLFYTELDLAEDPQNDADMAKGKLSDVSLWQCFVLYTICISFSKINMEFEAFKDEAEVLHFI